jgi:acetate kinase
MDLRAMQPPIGGLLMGKVTRSYALDPAVAAWLDKQPDGRGKMRSRSMMVSEAVYYYWMHDADTITTQNANLREINRRYLEELRELRQDRASFSSRLSRLFRLGR